MAGENAYALGAVTEDARTGAAVYGATKARLAKASGNQRLVTTEGSGRQHGYSEVLGMTLPELGSVRVSGTSYAKAVNANATQIGGEAGDAMFPYFTPERSFVDNMVAEALVKRGLLTKDTLTDIVMTDFTVPAFSKIRCDLAETAPNEGKDAEAVRRENQLLRDELEKLRATLRPRGDAKP